MLRRPLQQPYDGPFKVLQRKDKVFFLDINGKRVSVSIDRCKPAFFLNTEDLQLPQTKDETPATVEPNATASTPATVESDPTASTPTQPHVRLRLRSGRKVHLPTRNDKIRPPLTPPYTGPHLVKSRSDKIFICINNKNVTVTIDRCKPAFEFSEDLNSQKGSSNFEPPLTKQQIEDKTVVDKNIREPHVLAGTYIFLRD
ncbi:uncharacterized protein TNCV_2199811 [Trichonephila clavipes]|nr:uncharacterized protein TNCV_2199811 [Trichonephila clavipes]